MAAMRAATQPSRGPVQHGIRPFELGRDLRPVARLIAEAFANDLDAQGKAALRELRLLGYMGGLIRLLNRATTADFRGVFGGFVWVEEGRVVGNVTVQRLNEQGTRWQIANVAVEPAFRGRGIARALMEHALHYIHEMGGRWAMLQVRADNAIARGLYERLGFQVVGGMARLCAPRVPQGVAEPRVPGLEPFHPSEGHLLQELARSQEPSRVLAGTLVPREYIRVTPEARLGEWLSRIVGREQVLRMAVRDGQGRFQAALVLRARRWPGEHRLQLWTGPGLAERYEEPLVQWALAALQVYPRWPVEARLSIRQEQAIRALEARGFRNVHTLLTMQRSLP